MNYYKIIFVLFFIPYSLLSQTVEPVSIKIYSKGKINDELSYYKEFYGFEPESDFGIDYLIVKNSSDSILWKKELDDYCSFYFSQRYCSIYKNIEFADLDEPEILKILNVRSGELIKSLNLSSPKNTRIDKLISLDNIAYYTIRHWDHSLSGVREIDLNEFSVNIIKTKINDNLKLKTDVAKKKYALLLNNKSEIVQYLNQVPAEIIEIEISGQIIEIRPNVTK